MYFEDDYLYEAEDSCQQRNLICECESVYDYGCDCKRGEQMERNHCQGCACEQLRKLAENTLVLFSTGEAILLLAAHFIRLDKKTCCATLRILGADIYVNCRDIKVLVIP